MLRPHMNLSELIDTIQKECTITEQWSDPNFLSDLLLRLASYYSSLGQFVSSSERDAADAEMMYKVARERIKVEKSQEKGADGKKLVSDKVADSMAVVEVQEDEGKYIELKYKARLIFLTRQNLDKTMDAIRSKLSYIKSDREGSRSGI